MDPIDTLTNLRSKQNKGEKWTGIDVMKGRVTNMKTGDTEPLSVNQIVSAATEGMHIIRIDDVIATAKSVWSTTRMEAECHLNGRHGRNANCQRHGHA